MTNFNPLPLLSKAVDNFFDLAKQKNAFGFLMLAAFAVPIVMGFMIRSLDERLQLATAKVHDTDKLVSAAELKGYKMVDSVRTIYQGQLNQEQLNRIKEQAEVIKQLRVSDSIRKAQEKQLKTMSVNTEGALLKASSLKRKTDSLEKIFNKQLK